MNEPQRRRPRQRAPVTPLPVPAPAPLPEHVDIPFTDWIEQPAEEGAEPVAIPRQRTARIYLHMLPAGVLGQVATILQHLIAARNEADQHLTEQDIIRMFGPEMLSIVCAVWQLSEPRMTLERLERGASMADAVQLFFRLIGRSGAFTPAVAEAATNLAASNQ